MKVSVIIPSYNSSTTIERCIASLKAQTLAACEFIIVDDCSSDNTVELARPLTQGDDRFIILVQPTRTDPFQARARGINTASGEYIMFLDADDEFIPTACETAYNTAKEQAVDIFCFGASVIGMPGTSEIELRNTQKHLDSVECFTGKVEGREAVRSFYFKPNRFGTSIALWKKVFSRATLVEAINKINPPAPLRYGQDLIQLVVTMLHTNSIYIDNTIKLHKYFLGAGGTQQGKNMLAMSNFERILTTKNSLLCIQQYLEAHPEDEETEKRIIKHVTNTYLPTCTGNYWYLKDEDMLDGFKKLYNIWGEEIYTTPFFYSPTNLLRFKRCVIQKLDKSDPLHSKLSKKLYSLFLSIPIYKSKLYFKILFKR